MKSYTEAIHNRQERIKVINESIDNYTKEYHEAKIRLDHFVPYSVFDSTTKEYITWKRTESEQTIDEDAIAAEFKAWVESLIKVNPVKEGRRYWMESDILAVVKERMHSIEMLAGERRELLARIEADSASRRALDDEAMFEEKTVQQITRRIKEVASIPELKVRYSFKEGDVLTFGDLADYKIVEFLANYLNPG